MDVPSPPGDALAQPTRARLFSLLAELRRPAPTEELADRTGLHPNGVRTHLERLAEAGLVERRRERLSRGRPRDSWAVSPDARPGGDAPTGYAELARWLVRSLTAAHAPVRSVEATGRRIGREAVPPDPGGEGGPEERLRDVLVALGFGPQRELRLDGRLVFRLRTCPYREAVHERQALVCGLHRGLTRGLIDTIDPKTRLSGFVPMDPDTAGCLIELRGGMAARVAGERGEGEPA